jgi:hypothetical protein
MQVGRRETGITKQYGTLYSIRAGRGVEQASNHTLLNGSNRELVSWSTGNDEAKRIAPGMVH